MARHAGLETARAVAVGAVLAGHVSISYIVTPVGWAVQDGSAHLGVDVLLWIIRAFAMPVFFWLSGYFARAVLAHAGARGFVRHRLTRVLAPLAIALIPCSYALTALWAWGREVTARPDVAGSIPKFVASELPVVLGHLWYLYYLLWFSAVALAVATLWRRWHGPAIRSAAIVAIPFALVVGVFLHLGAVHTDTPMGFVPDLPIGCFMGAFFSWGWLVHGSPDELDRYARHAWHALAVAPLGLAPALLALYHLRDTPDAPAPLYGIAGSAVFSIAAIVVFVGLCVRYGRPHPIVRRISEASYWFYIVHVPVVVALQIVFAQLDWFGPLEYAAIFAITTALGLVTYELLIRRTPLRRVLG